MLIDSHIDFTNRCSPRPNNHPVSCGRPIARTDSYDRHLISQALQCSRAEDFVLHRGVYVAMLGPTYETRAEYRFLRKIGGHAAGMSTVPEVIVASQYGMRILAVSIITNVANPDALGPTSGQEVVDAAKVASPKLHALFSNAIKKNAKK